MIMQNLRRSFTILTVTAVALTACSSSSGSGTTSPTDNSQSSAADTETSVASTDNSGEEVSSSDYSAEMDKNTVMTFEIKADPEEWQSMLDNAANEEYILADITINGTLIENVGIRPKGNSTLSSIARDDSTDRYSFKIKFDKYVDDQTWMGLDKMVLNSNYSDKTSMKEYLSYDIMSYIGVEAPLFSFADISVNGENWGFYLAVEDYETGYLNRTTGGDGELYKPESMKMGSGMMDGQMPDGDMSNEEMPAPPEFTEGDAEFTPDGGDERRGGPNGGGMGRGGDDAVALKYIDDNTDSYSSIFDNDKTKTKEKDHRKVIEALKHLNEGTDLETYIDVDATLRYLAAHTVVVNLDSYSGSMAHNYVLYENDGQINILPWDYNMAFGGFQSENASDVVNFPIDTPVSGVSMEDRPLISKLLEVPEYRESYHQYLQEIVDGYFADGKFEQTVDALDQMIGEYVKADSSAFYTYEVYQTAVAELKKLGALRAESIQGQLDGSIPSTTDGQAADPDKLIDASAVDLSLLGDSMGGNKEGGFREGGKGRPGNGGEKSDN
ncbi:MAG: CotH kinase family protein [Lachnospiraceae bacterium]